MYWKSPPPPSSLLPPSPWTPCSSFWLCRDPCERVLRESAADVSIRRCWRTKPERERAEQQPCTEVWVNYPCLLSSRTTPASAGCVCEPHCRSSFRIQTIWHKHTLKLLSVSSLVSAPAVDWQEAEPPAVRVFFFFGGEDWCAAAWQVFRWSNPNVCAWISGVWRWLETRQR